MKLYPILLTLFLIIGLRLCHAEDIISTERGYAQFTSEDLESAQKFAAKNHGFIKREMHGGSFIYVVVYNETVITHTDINFEGEK